MSKTRPALEKARAAWGDPLPEWIKALATACDEQGLRTTSAKMGVSPALASLAVNRQREKLDYIKERVTRTLMVTIVACPVLGVMSRDQCLQEQAKEFTAANPLRVQLFRACRNGCTHYKTRKNKKGE